MTERKQMLPKWVRFISWSLLVLLAAPIFLIVGMFIGDKRYSLFGINYYGTSLRPLPIFMILVMISRYRRLWSSLEQTAGS
jgi:ABC-type spermidine/putrescine transport system permease subunit II